MWHSHGTGPDPTGTSSGTGRSKHYNRRRLKFYERDEGGPLFAPISDADRAEDKRIQMDMRKEAGI